MRVKKHELSDGAKKLKELRMKTGMLQKDFSKATGINMKCLQRCESAHADDDKSLLEMMLTEDLYKFSVAFDIPFMELAKMLA